MVAHMTVSMSSPTISYDLDTDPTTIIAQHHLLFPERLDLVKKDLRARIEKHEHDNQLIQYQIQELQRERLEKLTIQLHWETRNRIARALNDISVQNLLDKDEYVKLKLNGHSYLPVVLSSWAVCTNHEPATRLIDMGEIDDEAMDIHLHKGAVLRRDGLEESIEFVWDAIPQMEGDVMISMFLTRPPNRTEIAHPDPTVGQGVQLTYFDHRLLQAERDFIRNFIPRAEDKSKKRLFSD